MTAVYGLGNVLLGDDAFGPTVVRTFAAWRRVGGEVRIEDLGTPGLDLTPYLAGVPRVLIVDLVSGDQPPGTLRVLDLEEILAHPPGPRLGPHDPGLKEALLTLRLARQAPVDVRLVGVVGALTETGLGLSKEVEAAVPLACRTLGEILADWGHEVTSETEPREPDLWWLGGGRRPDEGPLG